MLSPQLLITINELSPMEKWELMRLLLSQLSPPKVVSDAQGDLGWPAGFLEQTYGSTADAPLSRLSQGIYEQREALA